MKNNWSTLLRIYLVYNILCLGVNFSFSQNAVIDSMNLSKEYHERFNLVNQFESGALSRYVYTHITEFFPNITIRSSNKVRPLPIALNREVDSFQVQLNENKISLSHYVKQAPVDGMIVIHKGNIVFEAYPQMQPNQRHLLMSVSKPFTSVLINILENRGVVDVNASIETYIPELKHTAWHGIKIINILDMASGICWEKGAESFNDPYSCFMQFDAAVGWSPSNEATIADPYKALQKMKRYKAQGLSNDYSSINTFVLSWLIEKVTGKRYTTFLEEELWQPMGAEDDGLMLTPKRNIAATYGGISTTLRDLGRFGLLFTPSGPKGVISDSYVKKIQRGGRPELLKKAVLGPFFGAIDNEKPIFSTYQWDYTMADGDFHKNGFHGQGLYVSPKRDLVIAYFGTPTKNGIEHNLKTISRQLAKSALFN
ncbi:MAG: serine hydrolase [Winogradskyella sp.]